ncbi:RHS repeat-associated core domain-containing protein [Paraburkholderia sp. BL21I4N1]|uniref:RHS repeat-associated core domain-containing protein n=1 Tax=Paraburkholderia sp. BL21I4N1 TaxID=1938801 RepID=UPI000CFA9EF2|nr:RHS repeat-associated core domain-containing protein [Paraburkholderia sp. BL21I4N1]PQV44565.1 RHS repeat-associated protein [Paraburkholderia sp. BL21I4N1]
MSAASAPTTGVVKTEVAIAPLVTIVKEDAGSALEQFDAWLKSASDGYITLERVEQLANAVPVVSNILSAIDVVMDIKRLIEVEARDLFDYLNLGIDLIGVIPLPPVMGEFRMGARPMLKLAREELMKSGRSIAEAGGQMISDAIISVLVAHLSTKFAGEIDAFVKEVQAKLAELLDACADHARQLLEGLAQIFEGAASGRLFDTTGNLHAADLHMQQASAGFAAHDARKVADSIWSYLKDGTKVFVKDAANLATRVANEVSPSTKGRLQQMAVDARHAIPFVTQKIKGLNSSDVGGLMWLLNALSQSVAVWRAKQTHRNAQRVGIKEAGKSSAERRRADGQLETVSSQANAQHPGPNDCKNCPKVSNGKHSVGYALGDERIDHEDFILPGAVPIVWRRTYRSFLDAYDRSELGARWITPYTTRVDIHEAKLVYHDPTGRSLDYPLLGAGATHEDLNENITLARLDEQWLTLTRGHEVLEAYEKRGNAFRLAFVKRRSGGQITLDYDAEHRLTRVVSEQAIVAFSHDARGRLIEANYFDPEGEYVGQLARYVYDEHGDLVTATDRYGNRREYTYQHHLVTRYTDRTGRGINLEWSGVEPKAKCVREYADDGSDEIRLSWHPDIRLVSVTDALGHVSRHYFDINGYTYRIIHPDNGEEWFYRDVSHNLTQHTYPDGGVDQFSYDDRGNPLEQRRADGSVVHMEYDAKDQITSIVDAHGHRWQREYDDAGHVITQIDPLGHQTAYSYNKQGLPETITDAKGGSKVLTYGLNGQIESYTDCSGKKTQWRYDDTGRLLESKDPIGRTTTYRYGDNGGLTAMQTPAGIEKFVFDAEGRLLTHTDPLDRTTRFSYDAAGRIAHRSDAAGRLVTYRHDPVGRLIALTDPNQATYRFSHDPIGRMTETVGFDGKITSYDYNQMDGKLKSIREAGAATRVAYDRGGRLLSRATEAAEERLAYDSSGRLIDAQNSHSRVQLFFDAVGNLVREHHAYRLFGEERSYVWRHDYDEIGTRIRTVRPDGHVVDWLTYGSGHVHGMMLDDRELIQFERDDLHRETQRTLSNRIEQLIQYEPTGRIAAQSLKRIGAPAAVAARSYRYDGSGQLLQVEDSRQGITTYRYDPVGRLIEAAGPLDRERFAYDPASNLIDFSTAESTRADSMPQTTMPEQVSRVLGNLLTNYAGTRFEYDARGNLVAKQSSTGRQRYTWDEFNRLETATVDEATRQHHARYFYDALGRRIGKEVDGVRTVFGWDGDALAFETTDESSIHYLYEKDSTVPIAQYIADPVVGIQTPQWTSTDRYAPEDDPLQRSPLATSAAVHVFFYHCDQIGTPQLLTDESGEVVWGAKYKVWGEAREVNARVSEVAKIAPHNPIRFQGQQWDEETGYAYNRFRYYDAQHGRFLSQDPIGLLGGMNVYQYAPNPILYVDPLGLARGKCTIYWYKTDESTGHYSVKTVSGTGSLHTEQEVSPDYTQTGIAKVSALDNREPANTATFDMPDVDAAQKFQRGKIRDEDGDGAYDVANNSCMTHVTDVLNAGGVQAPSTGHRAWAFLTKAGLGPRAR